MYLDCDIKSDETKNMNIGKVNSIVTLVNFIPLKFIIENTINPIEPKKKTIVPIMIVGFSINTMIIISPVYLEYMLIISLY